MRWTNLRTRRAVPHADDVALGAQIASKAVGSPLVGQHADGGTAREPCASGKAYSPSRVVAGLGGRVVLVIDHLEAWHEAEPQPDGTRQILGGVHAGRPPYQGAAQDPQRKNDVPQPL